MAKVETDRRLDEYSGSDARHSLRNTGIYFDFSSNRGTTIKQRNTSSASIDKVYINHNQNKLFKHLENHTTLYIKKETSDTINLSFD